MFVKGARNTPGNGTAVVAATATQRLQIGPFIQLQNKGATEVNVKLLLGEREIYDVLLEPKPMAVLFTDFPSEAGAGGVGESLYVNLSDGIEIYYQVQVTVIP